MSERPIVPEEWQALGFSGLFHFEVTMDPNATPEDVEKFAARLPTRLPFGTNSGILAVRVNRDQDPVTVTCVRQDAAAVMDLVRLR